MSTCNLKWWQLSRTEVLGAQGREMVARGAFRPLTMRSLSWGFVPSLSEFWCTGEICLALKEPLSTLAKLVSSSSVVICKWSSVWFLQIWIKHWLGKVFLVRCSFIQGFLLFVLFCVFYPTIVFRLAGYSLIILLKIVRMPLCIDDIWPATSPFFSFNLWVTQQCSGLLLTLSSGITHRSTWGTICMSGDWNRVSYAPGQRLIPCTISLGPAMTTSEKPSAALEISLLWVRQTAHPLASKAATVLQGHPSASQGCHCPLWEMLGQC